jgi:hypothetical protein
MNTWDRAVVRILDGLRDMVAAEAAKCAPRLPCPQFMDLVQKLVVDAREFAEREDARDLCNLQHHILGTQVLPPPKLTLCTLGDDDVSEWQVVLQGEPSVALKYVWDTTRGQPKMATLTLSVGDVEVLQGGTFTQAMVAAVTERVVLRHKVVDLEHCVRALAWHVDEPYDVLAVARQPRCPWRLRVTLQLMHMFKDLHHKANPPSPAALWVQVASLLRPAIARGWNLHAHGRAVGHKAFRVRNQLCVNAATAAMLMAVGVDPGYVVTCFSPGAQLWCLALLLGAPLKHYLKLPFGEALSELAAAWPGVDTSTYFYTSRGWLREDLTNPRTAWAAWAPV